MQNDGHLLVDNPNRSKAMWKSRTSGNPTAVVKLSDDGIAEIKDDSGDLLWTNFAETDGFVNALHLQKPPTAGNFPASSPANEPDLQDLLVSGNDESLVDDLVEDKSLGGLEKVQEADKLDGNEEKLKVDEDETLDESEQGEETAELHKTEELIQVDEANALDEIVNDEELNGSENFEESVISDDNEERVEVNESNELNALEVIGASNEIDHRINLDEFEENEVVAESNCFKN